MPHRTTVKSLMPDIVHPTSELDFADLAEHCAEVKIDSEEIIEAIMDAVRGVGHVKSVQRTGTVVTVQWSYKLPTAHVARRELGVMKVVATTTSDRLPEMSAT